MQKNEKRDRITAKTFELYRKPYYVIIIVAKLTQNIFLI